MNCCETRRHLEPFLDGELCVEANLEVLRHLGLCPPCSSIFEGEKQLLEMVRDNCCAQAPATLKDRIGVCLEIEARPRVSVLRLAVPMAAAGLIVALAASALSVPPAAAEPLLVARAAAAQHEKMRVDPPEGGVHLCPRCPESDAKARVAGYFQSKGQETCLHDLARAGYKFVQGWIAERDLAGKLTCWTCQKDPEAGRMVSHAHFAAPPGLDTSGLQPLAGTEFKWTRYTIGDRQVLFFFGKGQVCLFVTDSPAESDRILAVLK